MCIIFTVILLENTGEHREGVPEVLSLAEDVANVVLAARNILLRFFTRFCRYYLLQYYHRLH